MKTKSAADDETTRKLQLNFQRMFRCLDFGRSMQGRPPTLTVTQMRILSFFTESDVVYISEVSRRLGMSMQSVNNLVSRLEVLGYVERSKNADDKRLSDVRLTEKGKKGFEAFRGEQLAILGEMVSRLDAAEQKALAACVENAAAILERAVEKAGIGS